jgi:hypothetical protein
MCEQFKFKEKKIEYKSMFLNVILFYFSIINLHFTMPKKKKKLFLKKGEDFNALSFLG